MKSTKKYPQFTTTIRKTLQNLVGDSLSVKCSELCNTAVGSFTVDVKTVSSKDVYVESVRLYVVEVFRGGYGKQKYMRLLEIREDFSKKPIPEGLTRSYSDAGNLAADIFKHDLDPRLFERAVAKLNTGERHG